MDEYPKWTNVDGYGNITMYSLDKNGNVYKKKKPWNRIPAIKPKYNTNVNTNLAWSPSKFAPVSYEMNNMLYESCNLCNNYPSNSPCNNC